MSGRKSTLPGEGIYAGIHWVSWILHCCDEQQPKPTLWEEIIYFDHKLQLIIKGVQAET